MAEVQGVIVLDASAVLALLFKETGADRVRDVLGAALISTVNLSEAFARFIRDGRDTAALDRGLRDEMAIEIIDFMEADAVAAARLLPATRAYGLSFADRACLALAHRLGLPAMTADRAWRDVDCGVEVVCIR